MLRFAGPLFAASVLAQPAMAADIKSRDLGDGVHLITVLGDIKAGDEERFRALTLRYEKAIVALASDGGALTPALEIGRLINLRGYFTAVLNDYACTSACALIWTAGTKRFLGKRGRVGFHASYYESGGRKIEGGTGNALVGRYLTQLGMSERAIVFATLASPDSITWLTTGNSEEAGISFDSLEENPVEPPPLVRTNVPPPSVAVTGWTQVAEAENVKYYMDVARLGRVGAYRTGWEKADHSRNEKVSYYEAMQFWYFDCTGRRMALKSYIEYGRTGNVTDRGEFPNARMHWFTVVPESIGESKLRFACGR